VSLLILNVFNQNMLACIVTHHKMI